jgi:glycosyltransferase involved in cell wall biosynthesis
MRVVCLTNMYPTPTEPWLGVFVAEQVEDLRRLGVDVSVHAFDGRRDWKEYLRTGRRLRRAVIDDDFDLVQAHYGLTGAVALAQRLAPVITTFHGSDTFVPWQRAVSYVVARLTTPLFISQVTRAQLRCPSAAVVPVAVDTERFQPRPRTEARRLLGWDESGVYVLLPGSRKERVKNAALFDAALDTLPPDLNVRRVSLEGFTRDRVAWVMNAVDVTLMTSFSEGAGIAPRESLACNTPVVSVPVGDMPELLRALPGCAVCRREPQVLGEAVLRALEVGRSGVLRERATEYSRERIALKVLNVYDQALRRCS